MTNLKTTTYLVKAILEEDKRARNSDSFLYLKVLEHVAEDKGINVNFVPVTAFFQYMSEWGFPPFESVRRTRQKVQQYHPELAASKKVAAMRKANEAEFRDYARGDIQ